MSITAYEYLSILQAKDTAAESTESNGDIDYVKLLDDVRSVIATKHSEELASALGSHKAARALKMLILKYCVEELAGKEFDQGKLVEKIYQDMAGLGILTEYLYDPNVEEINVNGYNVIEINYPDRIRYLYDKEAFPTPDAALDIVKRMVRMGGMLLDAQTPRVDSYIGDGTRISAMIPPAVPQERGVIASIRKQNKCNIARQQLLDSGSVSADMLDFLTLCLCNGISIGLAGSTGSGKTTDQAYLLNEYIRKNDDYNNRVFIIEDSRELNLIGYDDESGRPARVLHTVTKDPPNPITMLDLIVSSLRFHPALIVPAEVRDAAAFQAVIAGQTGHTILTAFHADSALDAYRGLVSMCHSAQTGLSDELLLEMCAGAWPIMVYKKQLNPRLLYTDSQEPPPPQIARSSAIIVATAPSIFSICFSLSGLLFPVETVRMKVKHQFLPFADDESKTAKILTKNYLSCEGHENQRPQDTEIYQGLISTVKQHTFRPINVTGRHVS